MIGKKLLQAADRAVRKLRMNRSAVMREAVRSQLRQHRLQVQKEKADREASSRSPEALDRPEELDNVASWSDE